MKEDRECLIGDAIIGKWLRTGLDEYEYRTIDGHEYEYHYGILNTRIPDGVDSSSIPKAIM